MALPERAVQAADPRVVRDTANTRARLGYCMKSDEISDMVPV